MEKIISKGHITQVHAISINLIGKLETQVKKEDLCKILLCIISHQKIDINENQQAFIHKN